MVVLIVVTLIILYLFIVMNKYVVCKTNVVPCCSGQELFNSELKKMDEINNKLEQNLKKKNITQY